MIDGVEYQIDVTKPSRYDENGKLVSKEHRIVGLTYQGKPVKEQQQFLVATNNYRASGGGNFAGTGDDHVVISSPDESRSILASYISAQTKAHGQVVPSADNNWSFSLIKSKTDLKVTFETGNSEKAAAFIKERVSYDMEKVGNDDIGFALYEIDLQG